MKLSVVIVPALMCFAGQAQFENIGRKIEERAKQRAESRVDRTIERGFDKVEESIDNSTSMNKKDKKASKKNEKTRRESDNDDTETADSKENRQKSKEKSGSDFQIYSKFDFIPGEKVIALEDFSQDAIGDFPAKWNTNSGGEVVTITGKMGKWLKLGSDGVFYPEFLENLPENFTIEFDLFTSPTAYDFLIYFVDGGNNNLLNFHQNNMIKFKIDPLGNHYIQANDRHSGSKLFNQSQQKGFNFEDKRLCRLSIWRQKSRLRIYLNEEKLWDVPRAFEHDIPYRFVVGMDSYYVETQGFFISNLRVAVGLPDTRSKLLTEGRLVTRGITFDTGSDRIKSESYGVLREIAQVLIENPEVSIKIIGHTDSDGKPEMNLELSRKRAEAVARSLHQDFKIDAKRMTTEGKGASEPVEPNTTPQGKANNRRVEFVKL